MTDTEAEIRNQPSLWVESIDLARTRFDELQPFFNRPVALVGAGSSYYVGLVAAEYINEQGGPNARAVPASVYRPHSEETAVFISRSGMTTELVEGAHAAREAGARSVVVTCTPESPLARVGDTAVVLDYVREQSVVQTGSATSAIVFLRTLVDLLYQREVAYSIVDQLSAAFEQPIAMQEQIRHIVVLGSGWRYGIACEAALKAQEMAQMWTERYVPLEYRHGPISCADEHTFVSILDPTTPRISALAADIRPTGAQVLTAAYDPLVELVRMQEVVVRLTLGRGLNPDRPRNLTRSIILAGTGER